jgi:hypothetical protein
MGLAEPDDWRAACGHRGRDVVRLFVVRKLGKDSVINAGDVDTPELLDRETDANA